MVPAAGARFRRAVDQVVGERKTYQWVIGETHSS
jgi:hypothetical protein